MRGPKKEVTPLMSNDIYQTQLWQQQVAGFSVPQFKRNMWQVHVSHTHTDTHTNTHRVPDSHIFKTRKDCGWNNKLRIFCFHLLNARSS